MAGPVAAYTDLHELPSDVRTFVAEHARDQLCLAESWFELLLRYSPPVATKPRIYVVRAESDRKVECVLFTASPIRTPTHRARKLVSLTNFYTISYAPIVRADRTRAGTAIDALVAEILREQPPWDVVELRGLISEAPTTGELVRAFRNRGVLVDTYFQFENWYQPLSGISAREYFDTRPSQLRNTISRKLKKARREHRIDFRLYQRLDELPKALEDYQAVYARSWKEPEIYPEFIPRLLKKSTEEDHLRLGILYVDDQPAAAQVWLMMENRATIYKLAYDERYAQLSVGSILTKMMFDHAIDVDHVAEVDYGVGSEAYKLDWMSDCRHVVALLGFNPRSAQGLLAAGWHFAGRLLRRLSRSVRRSQSENPRSPIGAGHPAAPGEPSE